MASQNSSAVMQKTDKVIQDRKLLLQVVAAKMIVCTQFFTGLRKTL